MKAKEWIRSHAKVIAAVVAALVVLGLVGWGIAWGVSSPGNTAATTSDPSAYNSVPVNAPSGSASEHTPSVSGFDEWDGTSAVTLDQAKGIALAHAGVSAGEVTFTKAKLDHDDGTAEYDIEFVSDEYYFEYEVRAADGAILEATRQLKSLYDAQVAQAEREHEQMTQAQQQMQSAAAVIPLADAQAAALAHAGLSAGQVTFTGSDFEEHDGVWCWEVEFRAGGVEYDYLIHANTGAVLEAEHDR